MRTLLTLVALFVGVGISHAATIIDANSANISGTAYANHYAKYGQYFSADGKRLDMTTPTIARNASSGSTTYATESVYATSSRSGTTASNFGCSDDGGSGWRIRVNGSGASGISFEKMDAFKINEGADTATIADGDLMSFSGRIQNAGGSTMMAADTDSQFRFALQAAGSWYLSDPVNARAIGYPVTGAGNISASINPVTVNWYSYDPTVAPEVNGTVDVGALATPDFTQVQAAGIHQSLLSNGTAGNHGVKTFQVQGTINGASEVWSATNSVSWSNTDNATNTGSFYQNAGFNFGTTPANGTNYTSPDVVAGITAGTPIYGASYGSARYVTNGIGFGAAFDWGVFPNNNGGARLRLNKPDGGIPNGTNVHSGVTVGYNLFMFPLKGLQRMMRIFQFRLGRIKVQVVKI